MSNATQAAIEDLLTRAMTYGQPAAASELRRTLDPARARPVSANDVDSAIVRWADNIGRAIVPSDVEAAAERVVESLAASTRHVHAPS